MDKTQIHHISIYKIMHLNHKYIHRMLIFKLHPPQKKHQLPNTFHHGNLVLSTPTPPPPPQVAGNTDLGIMMDCESSSTRGYSSQGQFLRASVETRDQNGAGCVPRKRFTLHGDGNYDLGFFVVAIFWLGNELFGSSKLSLRLQYVLFWEIIHM